MKMLYKQKVKNGDLTIIRVDTSGCMVELKDIRNAIDDYVYKHYDDTIKREVSGAPLFEKNDKKLSISHTFNYFSIYVNDDFCGVDIEKTTRNASKVARKFTTDEEVLLANNVYKKNPHLLIWCSKEALYKKCRVAGAEFKHDFILLSSSEDKLVFKAFHREIEVNFFEIEDLLVAYC